MRLHIKALAAASATAGMLLYLFGAVMDRVSAWGAAAVVSFIFRVDIVELTSPLTWTSFVMGLLLFAFVFAAVGAMVGVAYNLFTGAMSRVPATPGVTKLAGHSR